MSTKLLVGLTTLLLLGAAALAADIAIWASTFNDGAKIEWACPAGTRGVTHFRFTTTDGSQYMGSLSCGTPV